MLEKLGGRKYAAPALAVIAIACVMSLMFYPMANMRMEGLPFALLTLDEGAKTPQGEMNLGETVAASIEAAAENGEGAPIAWTRMDSQEELDQALEQGGFYGALIVPADFSAQTMAARQSEAQAALQQAQALVAAQAASQAAGAPGATAADAAANLGASAALAGAASGTADAETAAAPPSAAAAAMAADAGATAPGGGEAASAAADPGAEASGADPAAGGPKLQIILDNAKSPLVATQMKTAIPALFQQMGVQAEAETIHEGSSDSSEDASATPLKGMASQQLTIAPLFITSAASALILSRVLKAQRTQPRALRWKIFGKQAGYAAILSLIASLCVYGVLLWVGGIEAPFAEFTLFMWLASFCVMLLLLGAFNLSTALGAIIALCALAGGTMCGMLPYETLPSFWQDWIYPWAPQRFIGEGLRAVLYLGEGAWNGGSAPLLAIAATGALLTAFAGCLPGKESRPAKA